MLSLPEVQSCFARALFSDTQAVVCSLFASTGNVEKRLAVYRNNVLSNRVGALRALYPVLLRLTGDDWFDQVAHRYASSHVSQSGDLDDYGESFPLFLQEHSAVATDYPYLPDMARLEWLVSESFRAADAGRFDYGRLAAVPQDQLGDLRFTLHPSCRLVQSAYPVHRIWHANQPDQAGEEEISLEEGGAVLLIFREPDYIISVEPLEPQLLFFVRALQSGQPLSDIVDGLPEQGDLGVLLPQAISRGLVADFHTGEQSC